MIMEEQSMLLLDEPTFPGEESGTDLEALSIQTTRHRARRPYGDPKLVVFHVEDNPDWQDIIRDAVEDVPGLMYMSTDNPLHRSMDELQEYIAKPAIVVVDLRLGNFPTEFSSLDWLVRNASHLIEDDCVPLVVSGHIPEGENRTTLIENSGIPEEHVFGKAPFDSVRFVQVLRSLLDTLQGIPRQRLPRNLMGENPAVCRIVAKFLNKTSVNGFLRVHPERDYTLRVTVTTLPSATRSETIVGSELFFYVRCMHAEISPRDATVQIQHADLSISKDFTISFRPQIAEVSPCLMVLIYHRNHLMSLMEFTIGRE